MKLKSLSSCYSFSEKILYTNTCSELFAGLVVSQLPLSWLFLFLIKIYYHMKVMPVLHLLFYSPLLIPGISVKI